MTDGHSAGCQPDFRGGQAALVRDPVVVSALNLELELGLELADSESAF